MSEHSREHSWLSHGWKLYRTGGKILPLKTQLQKAVGIKIKLDQTNISPFSLTNI